MNINREVFFDGVRHQPFPGSLDNGQVKGMDFIIDEWEKRRLDDPRWLANIFGQTKIETAHTMLPIAEYDNAAGTYLKSQPYYPYYGRGFVMITWKENYQKFQPEVLRAFNVDIVANPDDAMIPEVAAYILFEGMIKGTFTGLALEDFFNDTTTDWVNARKIVNGLDRAEEIAGITKQFFADIVIAGE